MGILQTEQAFFLAAQRRQAVESAAEHKDDHALRLLEATTPADTARAIAGFYAQYFRDRVPISFDPNNEVHDALIPILRDEFGIPDEQLASASALPENH